MTIVIIVLLVFIVLLLADINRKLPAPKRYNAEEILRRELEDKELP